jgi:hypothetical protein
MADDRHPPTRSEPSRLALTRGRGGTRAVSGLLQQGVAVVAKTGCSVLEFLIEQLGLAPDYVAGRITTVFLDGQVVDALDTATLRDGARLTLSAAMPGLVGATLRRSGVYARMRAEITRAPDRTATAAAANGIVHVKLFNLLIEELGPVLLARGVVVPYRDAMDALGGWCAGLDALREGAPVSLRVSFA